MNPEIMNKNLLLIERKQLYYKSEEQRKSYNFDDEKLLQYAIECCEFSFQTKDWRYLNLAIKILDSESLKVNKYKLKKIVTFSFEKLKKTLL